MVDIAHRYRCKINWIGLYIIISCRFLIFLFVWVRFLLAQNHKNLYYRFHYCTERKLCYFHRLYIYIYIHIYIYIYIYIKSGFASRGVAQRCGILCASLWSLVRVVAGTMLGGGGAGISRLALRPHSGSLGVLGWGLWPPCHSSYSSIQHSRAGGVPIRSRSRG